MKVAKGKPHKPPPAKVKAEPPSKVSKASQADVEQALVEEVAGTQASPAKLKQIVERVLGGGDDSQVQALVRKLSQAARTTTTGPYPS